MAFAPPISVVVPMRNAATWLPPLLAALVREWHTGFELIAIDDASSDGSDALLQRLCAHWPQERWQLIRTGGCGVSAARNAGVAASRAPLIAFLDADDRPLPGRLSLPLQAFARYPHLSHVHGGWWRCDDAGRHQQAVRPWQEGAGFSWRSFMQHKAVLPSAWTVRRDALLAVGGFDPQLRHSEDVDLLLRLAAAGHEGAWIEQELVRYRLHGANASGRTKAQLQGLLAVMERHLEAVAASEPGWARSQRYDTTTWASWQAWSDGAPDLALQLLQQALEDCPYPLPRRPVHYLEVFARSCARIGQRFDAEALQASRFWRQAQELLLAR